MESQPERPVEKWLRAAAKKRREEAGGPFELHPADRRRLQDEVSRTYAEPAQSPHRPQTWWRVWPRLAWGLGMVAVLGIVVWIVVPKPVHETKMLASRNDTATRARTDRDVSPATEAAPLPRVAGLARNEPAGPPAAAPAPKPGSSTGAAVELAQEESRAALAATKMKAESAAALASAPAVAAPPTEAPAATPAPAQPPALFARRFGSPRPNAAAPTTPLAEIAPTNALAFRSEQPAQLQKLAVADAVKNLRASQQFSNLAPPPTVVRRELAAAPKPLSSQVLNNFNVEQAGNELRVVDEDGSVYAGFVEAEAAPAQGQLAGRAGMAGGEPNKQQALSDQAQNYYFRVAGTNRSLNQRVVFTGNLVPGTNPVAQVLDGLRNQAVQNNRAQQQNTVPVPPVPLQNFRMAGQAVVGERQQLMINAVPAGK